MRTFAFAAIGSLFSALAAAQTPTLEMQNEQVVRQQLDAINRHDAKAAAAAYAEDVKNFGRPLGRKGMEAALADIFNTFPDWHVEIESIVASGDQVVVRSRVTGTHQGVGKMPLNGMPVGVAATGKHFEVGHMHWNTLRGGQIVEHSASRDDLGMLRQLGLLTVVAPAQ